MDHTDLLEDIVLAMIVASTTVATLYVGWRAGRAAKRSLDGDGGRARGRGSISVERTASRERVGVWNRRLASEQARHARNGASATIVIMRLGRPRGPLARRSEPEMKRTAGAAEQVARRSRGSDVVCVTDDGLIRILLVETPEAGARAYVDRISQRLGDTRETPPLNLVAAWAAIAPSRDLAAADRLATARLRGATSGWLRSLAVHQTANDDVAVSAADDEQYAAQTSG